MQQLVHYTIIIINNIILIRLHVRGQRFQWCPSCAILTHSTVGIPIHSSLSSLQWRLGLPQDLLPSTGWSKKVKPVHIFACIF